jgi:prenyltransferase beta subunit
VKALPALALLCFVPALVLAQTPDQKKGTLDFLYGLQTKEGDYRAAPGVKTPSLRATSSALRAIKYFGGKPKYHDATQTFVTSCFDEKTGGFADTPGGKPDVVLTSVGLMALVELGTPRRRYQLQAIEFMTKEASGFEQVRMVAAGLEAVGQKSEKNTGWLKELAAKQNPDGTFGKGDALARETGSAVAAVLRLGGKVRDPEAVRKALDGGQRKDGGFGKAGVEESDLETSYRVMRTYHMLGSKPGRAEDLRGFVARCRNADGGYGVAPGQPSNVGGTYFAGIILYWLDKK